MRPTYATSASDLGGPESARLEVLEEHDFGAFRSRYRPGHSIGPLPYGLHGLERLGVVLTQHQYRVPKRMGIVSRALEHRTGMKWELPLSAAPTLGQCDAVLAIFEDFGYLASLARSRRLPPFSRVPLVVYCCWLPEAAARATKDELARLRRRVRGIDLLVTMSSNQTELLSDLLAFPAEKQLSVLVGVDTDYYSPANLERDIDVVAVGADRGRDFACLVEAARGAQFSVTLVTSLATTARLDVPPNVRTPGPVDHPTYRALLRRAKVVVVPTRELAYPTGSSVALEAMACGCAVVVSDTPAMRDYLAPGIDSQAVPVGDPGALRLAVEDLLSDESVRKRLGTNARAAAITRFVNTRMWEGVWSTGKARGLW